MTVDVGCGVPVTGGDTPGVPMPGFVGMLVPEISEGGKVMETVGGEATGGGVGVGKSRFMAANANKTTTNRTPSLPMIAAMVGIREGVGCVGGSGLRSLPGGTGGTRNPNSSSTCLPSGVTLSVFCDSTINCARNNGDSLRRKVSIETPMSRASTLLFSLPS